MAPFLELFFVFWIESAIAFSSFTTSTSRTATHLEKRSPNIVSSTSTCTVGAFQLCATNAPKPIEHGEEKNEDVGRWVPLTITEKSLVPIRLVLGIYALMLLPAGIAHGKLCAASLFQTLPYEYNVFFGLLVIPRAFRFGTFAKTLTAPAQPKNTMASKRDVLLFIGSLVASHWSAAFRCSRSGRVLSPNRFLVVIRLLATALVATSGWVLGKSYDRVTKPFELVVTGPYRYVRHPIYTAYFLFFGGSLMAIGGAVEYCVWLLIAVEFYRARMDAEDELLAAAFGEEFHVYKESVPWRLFPRIY